jgi:hypothetical protein
VVIAIEVATTNSIGGKLESPENQADGDDADYELNCANN